MEVTLSLESFSLFFHYADLTCRLEKVIQIHTSVAFCRICSECFSHLGAADISTVNQNISDND